MSDLPRTPLSVPKTGRAATMDGKKETKPQLNATTIIVVGAPGKPTPDVRHIWMDSRLTLAALGLVTVLVDLNDAGVITWHVGSLHTLVKDCTTDEIHKLLTELAARGYVILEPAEPIRNQPARVIFTPEGGAR